MEEKIIELCKRVDDSVDYTQKNLVDGKLITSAVLIDIVSEISDEYDIEIPYEDIIPRNFNSIESMVKLVESYIY